MHLTETTWTDVEAADTDLAVIPVGSTEQHGPHAPLGTDVLTAEAITDYALDRIDREVIRAPAIPIGIAEEHRHFAGTMWVSPDTFRDYIRESVASLAHHGFTRVVLVNGHGGNVDALKEVAATITRHDDAYAVPFTWFEAVGEHTSEMGHGGPLETALLLECAPDLLHTDRFEAAREGGSSTWGEWVSDANLAVDTVEFSENGVVGDPTAGDAELGAELLERASDSLVRLLEAVATRDRGER